MTKPQQLIQDILLASANDNLVDAEKAIEEYVCKFNNWRMNDVYEQILSGNSRYMSHIPSTELYQQYINQK